MVFRWPFNRRKSDPDRPPIVNLPGPKDTSSPHARSPITNIPRSYDNSKDNTDSSINTQSTSVLDEKHDFETSKDRWTSSFGVTPGGLEYNNKALPDATDSKFSAKQSTDDALKSSQELTKDYLNHESHLIEEASDRKLTNRDSKFEQKPSISPKALFGGSLLGRREVPVEGNKLGTKTELGGQKCDAENRKAEDQKSTAKSSPLSKNDPEAPVAILKALGEVKDAEKSKDQTILNSPTLKRMLASKNVQPKTGMPIYSMLFNDCAQNLIQDNPMADKPRETHFSNDFNNSPVPDKQPISPTWDTYDPKYKCNSTFYYSTSNKSTRSYSISEESTLNNLTPKKSTLNNEDCFPETDSPFATSREAWQERDKKTQEANVEMENPFGMAGSSSGEKSASKDLTKIIQTCSELDRSKKFNDTDLTADYELEAKNMVRMSLQEFTSFLNSKFEKEDRPKFGKEEPRSEEQLKSSKDDQAFDTDKQKSIFNVADKIPTADDRYSSELSSTYKSISSNSISSFTTDTKPSSSKYDSVSINPKQPSAFVDPEVTNSDLLPTNPKSKDVFIDRNNDAEFLEKKDKELTESWTIIGKIKQKFKNEKTSNLSDVQSTSAGPSTSNKSFECSAASTSYNFPSVSTPPPKSILKVRTPEATSSAERTVSRKVEFRKQVKVSGIFVDEPTNHSQVEAWYEELKKEMCNQRTFKKEAANRQTTNQKPLSPEEVWARRVTTLGKCIDTLFNPPENSDDLKKAMSFLENLHKYISTNQLVPAKSKEEQDKEREEKERTEKKLKELQNELNTITADASRLKAENARLKEQRDTQQAIINSYKDQEPKLTEMRKKIEQLNDEKQQLMYLERERKNKELEQKRKEIEQRCQKELQELRDTKEAEEEARGAKYTERKTLKKGELKESMSVKKEEMGVSKGIERIMESEVKSKPEPVKPTIQTRSATKAGREQAAWMNENTKNDDTKPRASVFINDSLIAQQNGDIESAKIQEDDQHLKENQKPKLSAQERFMSNSLDEVVGEVMDKYNTPASKKPKNGKKVKKISTNRFDLPLSVQSLTQNILPPLSDQSLSQTIRHALSQDVRQTQSNTSDQSSNHTRHQYPSTQTCHRPAYTEPTKSSQQRMNKQEQSRGYQSKY